MNKFILLLVILFLPHSPLFGESSPAASAIPCPTTIHDLSIRKWSKYYIPEAPWYWSRAQWCAESGLRERAVSPVGASGLTQLMPGTFKDLIRRYRGSGEVSDNPSYNNVFNPSLNIQLGSAYMRQMRGNWDRRGRNEWQIHELALASYNAGIRNVLDSQSKCDDGLLWDDVKQCLPKVTGHHHKETWNYVDKIDKWIDLYESHYDPFLCIVSDCRPLGRRSVLGESAEDRGGPSSIPDCAAPGS